MNGQWRSLAILLHSDMNLLCNLPLVANTEPERAFEMQLRLFARVCVCIAVMAWWRSCDYCNWTLYAQMRSFTLAAGASARRINSLLMPGIGLKE